MQITQTAGKNRRTMQPKHVAAGAIASIQPDGAALKLHLKTPEGEIYLVQINTADLEKIAAYQATLISA
jgi:hypothetical protein